MPTYPGVGRRNVTIDGRAYSKIRWERCACRVNAKPISRSATFASRFANCETPRAQGAR
jgi:hypothetical protein